MRFQTLSILIAFCALFAIAHADITLTVDVSRDEGPVTYRASGFLHALTADTPGDDMLNPLKPRLVRVGGTDANRAFEVYDRVTALGGKIQIILADVWLFQNGETPITNWGTFDTMLNSIVSRASGKTFQWDIWNEPNGDDYWKGTDAEFHDAWKTIYGKVRSRRPGEKIIGPSTNKYDENYLKSFLTYCKANDVVPDYLCWHEFNSAGAVEQHINSISSWMDANGISVEGFQINEFVHAAEQTKPGHLVDYYAAFERAKINGACHACWMEGSNNNCWNNSLNGLLTPDMNPRGTWWAAKSYADITGRMVYVEPEIAIDGVAGIDAGTGELRILVGRTGGDGDAYVEIDNISAGAGFAGAMSVHVVAHRIDEAGYSHVPALLPGLDEDFPVDNDAVTVRLPDCIASDAYQLVVTPGSGGTPKVNTPVISPQGGIHTGSVSVTISCATSGAAVRYTTDGSEPTESSSLYSSALSITSTTTLKAKAFKSGATASTTSTAVFTIAAAGGDVYTASADFSGTQGYRNWTYRSSGSELSWDGSKWAGSNYLSLEAANAHPGTDSDAVRRWTVPAAGSVRITGTVEDLDDGGGDGIIVSIKKNSTSLWQKTIANGGSVESYDLTADVAAGDVIDFILDRNGTNAFDYTEFDPTIAFTAVSGTETVSTPAISPAGGTYTDAVTVTLSCATSGATIRYTTDGSDPTESSTAYSSSFSMIESGVLKVRAFKIGATTSDAASASFTITSGTGSDTGNVYTASEDFSSTQGTRHWTYRDSDGLLAYDGSAWKGVETYLLLEAGAGHPGNARDAILRWTVPEDGNVRITGNASDLDDRGGDGVIVSILMNGTSLWQRTLANGDTDGQSYDLSETVSEGNTIDFVINQNASSANDMTAFDPTITFSATLPADVGLAGETAVHRLEVSLHPVAGKAVILGLPTAADICVELYGIDGTLATTLHDGPAGAGMHRLAVDVPGGVYCVRAVNDNGAVALCRLVVVN